MTTVLAFDTSAAHCAVALLHGDRLTTRVDAMARGQAEHLVPLLEEMLAAADLAWRDLSALGVGTGPGNFTGIRISVATARGLSLGLGIPAIGVSGFETVAHGAARPVTVALPAPRERAYVQQFDGGEAGPARLIDLADVPAHALPPLPAEEAVARIARIAAGRLGGNNARPAPLYVRPADAAPSRDAAPVILP